MCASRRPVAAVLGSHFLALGPGARGNTNTLDAVVRYFAACLGRNARPGCIAGLYGKLTVADPCFQGSGEAVESLLSRMTDTRPRTPAPSPMARYAHRASHSIGHGQNNMGQKGGDKFGEFFLGRPARPSSSPKDDKDGTWKLAFTRGQDPKRVWCRNGRAPAPL